MKLKHIIFALPFLFIINCSKKTNDPEFIKNISGRYLYNSDEIVKIYFNESDLFMEWRGAKSIKPLKISDSTFFVKEMNEKIYFAVNPKDKKMYMVKIPKEENQSVEYSFRMLDENEKTPSEYLINNEFQKALKNYQNIKERDSLDESIKESNLNSIGYRKLREKKYENAIEIFKINVALYPESSNVYDSLADAFMRSGDTIQAIENYKKSLIYDSGNASAKRIIKRLEKKS